ncbi:MAG: hypothetical protein IKG70_01815 [Lachnospiraceae bacterium]|nr:hypothetical protein [Lachnospiraceae bacterium]
MEIGERRKLVARLLAASKKEPLAEAEVINSEPDASFIFVEEHLRQYVLAKYMLPPDCKKDNILALARLSLEITLQLDENALRELDQATPCNHAKSETTKKVLLLYAVQRDLHLPENPAQLSKVKTVTELAQYVCEARRGFTGKNS